MNRVFNYVILLLLFNSCSLSSNQVDIIDVTQKVESYMMSFEEMNYSYCYVRFWSNGKLAGYILTLDKNGDSFVNVIRLLDSTKDDFIQVVNQEELAKFLKENFEAVKRDSVADIKSISNRIDPNLDIVYFYNGLNGNTEKLVFTNHDTHPAYKEKIEILKCFLLDVEIEYPRKSGTKYFTRDFKATMK